MSNLPLKSSQFYINGSAVFLSGTPVRTDATLVNIECEIEKLLSASSFEHQIKNGFSVRSKRSPSLWQRVSLTHMERSELTNACFCLSCSTS